MTHAESGSYSTSIPILKTYVVEDVLYNERGFARGPVRALMSALLFDGIQAYMNYAEHPSSRSVKRYQEAFHWVNIHGSEYIFSFDSVCEALGIDPDYLRYGLANATNSRVARKKARRTF